MRHHEVPIMYTDDIDDYGNFEGLETLGVWKLFKKLRKYGLERDQIGILVRKFGANMTHRQILKDMGWVSHSTLSRRYSQALQTLRERGFNGS